MKIHQDSVTFDWIVTAETKADREELGCGYVRIEDALVQEIKINPKHVVAAVNRVLKHLRASLRIAAIEV